MEFLIYSTGLLCNTVQQILTFIKNHIRICLSKEHWRFSACKIVCLKLSVGYLAMFLLFWHIELQCYCKVCCYKKNVFNHFRLLFKLYFGSFIP